MVTFLSTFFGGLIAVYFLSAIWEWALFKRIFNDPLKGKMSATGAAWLSSGFIAGYGMADGGGYFWRAFLLYLPPALVLAYFAYRRGNALRHEQPTIEMIETFD